MEVLLVMNFYSLTLWQLRTARIDKCSRAPQFFINANLSTN